MRKIRDKKWMQFLIPVAAALLLVIAIWGPERLADYQDRTTLNHVEMEAVENPSEGYRYSLNSNEKLYILAKCLDNQILPESEGNSLTKAKSADNAAGVNYEDLTGTYAFVVNRGDTSEKAISDEEIYEICNRELEELKSLNVIPDTVREVKASAYNAVLYSAIDVLEPRNNLSVWKVSLSTSYQNANKANRLLDAYIDADTGRIYEFYVRTEVSWEDIDPDDMIEQWSGYMGLTGGEEYEDANPLLETTPNYKKYRFPGMEEGSTVVTVGFYDGINELFLKISR